MTVETVARKPYTIPLYIKITLLLTGLALCVLIEVVTSAYTDRLLDEVHESAEIEMKAQAVTLTSMIENRFLLSDGLRAFVLSQLSDSSAVDPSAFAIFSSQFMENDSGIRNLSIYPDGIASLVYPIDDNDEILGMNLFVHADADVRDNAYRTLSSQAITILGPFELTQGGMGMLSRQAIYIDGQFWGFVSVVLDIPSIIQEAGIYNLNKGIALAVRAGDQILTGDAALFDDPEHLIPIPLPEGEWELAAAPIPERLASANQQAIGLKVLFYITLIFVLYFIYIQLTKKDKLQALVEERTRELESKENAVRYMAYHDSVTRLYNRAYFNEAMERQLQQSALSNEAFALIYLDVDNLKLINDSLGHYYGDMLLIEIADRLSQALNNSEVVCRLGGDEFTIILPAISDQEQVHQIAAAIITLFQQPFQLSDIEHYITASIGVAIYPEHGEDATSLVKNADTTMYRAKENGKNQYLLYNPAMHTEHKLTMEISNGLRRALENDEFVMHYQPQIEAATGQIIGLEALIRWNHPEQGMVSPGMFIPIAEESGLIVPIGEKVLQLVSAQSRAWQNAGYPPIKIAVNLSAKQFRHSALPSVIMQILQDSDINPCHIELEITENEAMRDDTQLMLQELREQGFIISIDDFGTQYSSLSYLTRLPVDKIKLDRSFVHGIANNTKDEAIIRAILLIAKHLELTVIAEGVETYEQLLFLSQHECHQIQGFLFHKPMAADAIEELLVQHQIWSR